MKKRPSRFPVFILFLFIAVAVSGIALGVVTVKPSTSVIEQDVKLPIAGTSS